MAIASEAYILRPSRDKLNTTIQEQATSLTHAYMRQFYKLWKNGQKV